MSAESAKKDNNAKRNGNIKHEPLEAICELATSNKHNGPETFGITKLACMEPKHVLTFRLYVFAILVNLTFIGY